MARSILTCVVLAASLASAGWSQGVVIRPKARKASPPRRMIVDRWNQMLPEERKKALDRLPPERRAQIERQLEDYRNLSPEERRQLHSRYESFNQLPPEQQNRARRLYRQFNQMPADRRPELRREFEKLRALPESERQARFSSEEFQQRFNVEERELLRSLSDLVPEHD